MCISANLKKCRTAEFTERENASDNVEFNKQPDEKVAVSRFCAMTYSVQLTSGMRLLVIAEFD